MTRLLNKPETFADEAIAGFVAANRQYVRAVDGGVVRATRIPAGQVAVVVGGGSGHYPAFAGLVGPGLASGSACGNMFASPSAGQVVRVSQAVDRGAGVLLTFGNYAGDVLNFGQARDRLVADGIDARIVAVTDDIASGSVDEIAKRRGIAGDLTVFKVAGAAAEAGADLDEVERLANLANDRTRSLGVAFTGCTLPGASDELFTVPEGMMSLGLGIHGEPGISEMPVPTADGLADILVDRLLAERPSGASDRVIPILNGLGAVKYDELFVLFGAVAQRLEAAGLTIVAPECGELVTSLDMAGVSLTLFWPDDALEAFWTAPADTPAFRKGSIERELDTDAAAGAGRVDLRGATAESEQHRAAAPAGLALFVAVKEMILESEEEFGLIDAIAGDGDHGIGMSRGVTGAVDAAQRVVDEGAGVSALLIEAGDGWAEHAGGTSGALWGNALQAAGRSLGAASSLDAHSVVDAVAAGLAAMQSMGKAEVGDKTMIDAFTPFADTLASRVDAGDSVAAAWTAAAEAATAAAVATADLRPKLGRARPLAEKSLGHPDAGAISLARIATTVGRAAFATSTKDQS
ncbi:dihydroxyacetone kinase [Conyzicola lurida]|uniref:Dihydroxyacetone kinase n=1 Tax=Conyzicola lurida TaxID=1172621 RepID=A0A841AKZ2_9MICO|nr:dihydroxyacetone kinase family protein [Conyzicola lurida]MBB5842109.1 dihydroxyacetone kinase [Conyzicola lurida]